MINSNTFGTVVGATAVRPGTPASVARRIGSFPVVSALRDVVVLAQVLPTANPAYRHDATPGPSRWSHPG